MMEDYSIQFNFTFSVEGYQPLKPHLLDYLLLYMDFKCEIIAITVQEASKENN